MRVELIDPANPSTFGAWTSKDPVTIQSVLSGQRFTLEHDLTSSDDIAVLYDLSVAPEFFDNSVVQCQVDAAGTLHMVLSPNADGSGGVPLADIPDFRQAVESQAFSGSGQLFLPNKLPPAINWTVGD
jgi:hypothetical protein